MTQTAVLTGTQWKIDPTHSEIAFKVKHLMITNVKGVFSKYEAYVQSPGSNLMDAEVDIRIDPTSITTGDAHRDQHLRGVDFFDTENHGDIRFVSTSAEKTDADSYTLFGNLTMKGITKPIHLNVELGGIATDPWGNQKAGITVNGKINRKDWDLNWNAALETGGVLVSDEVRISAEIQLVKEQ